jgi:pimeloyl-ACP methyl ester carboxylesterase
MGMPALPLDRVLVEQLTRNQSGAALTRARADAEKMMAAIKNGTSRDPSAIWYRSEFPIDPPQLIARVPVPMLLLQGGKDVQVYAKHLPLLVAAARATHRDLTVREFPNDGHLMMQMPTSDKPLDEYTTAAHFDPNVLAAIFAWLARN